MMAETNGRGHTARSPRDPRRMPSVKATGRWIGVGILLGYAGDIWSNFWLQPGIRISQGPIGLLEGAAQQPQTIALIVALGLASGLLAVIMAGLICGITRDRPAFGLALMYLGVTAASLGMGGVEMAGVQMMRAFGDALAGQTGGQAALSGETLQLVVTSLRNSMHFPHLLTAGFSAVLLYLILWRSRLIPGLLGIAGLAASMSQMTGVFTGIMGREVHIGFLMPLFVVHLILAIWLITRGFKDRSPDIAMPAA